VSDEEDLLDMMGESASLIRSRAAASRPNVSEAIMPDIVVRPSVDGSWLGGINPDALPRVLGEPVYCASVSKTARTTPSCRNAANRQLADPQPGSARQDDHERSQGDRRQQDAFLIHGVDPSAAA